MSENRKCHYCDENEPSEIIEEEPVCWECIDDEYFICPQTGEYCKIDDKKELDGEWYSPDGFDEVVVYCEWSGNEIHRDRAICVNGDYYIDEDLCGVITILKIIVKIVMTNMEGEEMNGMDTSKC